VATSQLAREAFFRKFAEEQFKHMQKGFKTSLFRFSRYAYVQPTQTKEGKNTGIVLAERGITCSVRVRLKRRHELTTRSLKSSLIWHTTWCWSQAADRGRADFDWLKEWSYRSIRPRHQFGAFSLSIKINLTLALWWYNFESNNTNSMKKFLLLLILGISCLIVYSQSNKPEIVFKLNERN